MSGLTSKTVVQSIYAHLIAFYVLELMTEQKANKQDCPGCVCY